MKVSVRVAGWAKVTSNIEELERRITRGVMREALTKSGRIMAAKARAVAPVDTGTLKRSLKIAVKTSRKKGVVVARIGASGKEVRNAAGDDLHPARYLHLVEYGTRHSPPQPFMRQAFESTKGEVSAKYHAELVDAIPRIAAKIYKTSTRINPNG